MPAPRKRVGKRTHAQKSAAARVACLALDMEQPLNDALDAAHALRLLGHGLNQIASEEDGRAAAAIAWTVCQRLNALQQLWRQLFKHAAQARS